MKAYNLVAVKSVIGEKEISTLNLGESGRARKLIQIIMDKDIKNDEQVEIIAPKPGMPGKTKIRKMEINTPGYLSRISTNGAYIRGDKGNVRYLKTAPMPEVVAKGNGAFGDAGGIGSWDDLLLKIPDDAILRVKPTRGDAYFLHFTPSGVVKLTLSQLDIYDTDIPTDLECWEKL